MKKLFATLSLFLVLLPAFAQEITEELQPEALQLPDPEVQLPVQHNPLNEIDLSIGLGTGLQVVGAYASFFVSLFGTIFSKDTYILIPFFVPALSLEYDRWINDKVAIGASVNADIVSALPYLMVGNVAVMPDVKFRWLDKPSVKLYSKLAVGYSTTIYGNAKDGKLKIQQMPTDNFSSLGDIDSLDSFQGFMTSSILRFWLVPPFGIQAVPIGIDIGSASQKVHGFLELGIGTQGSMTFGIKTAF